jgi:hypothetical protein
VLVDSAAYDELASFNNLLFLGCGYADQEWGWGDDVPRATIQIYNVGSDAAPFDDTFITHPSSLLLYPAYPNPFNSATAIKYALPCPGDVALRIYNPLGQQVGTLFEGFQLPGFHTATLTADDLPSGLYFVRLKVEGGVASRKVLLIK